MEKGQRCSREAEEEEGQEAVAGEGTVGLCDGKLGKELLTASFRIRFRREEIPRRLPCGWKSPHPCLNISLHEVMNEDVLVLAGRSPERDMGSGHQRDTGQQGGFPVSTLPTPGRKPSPQDKPLVPRRWPDGVLRKH